MRTTCGGKDTTNERAKEDTKDNKAEDYVTAPALAISEKPLLRMCPRLLVPLSLEDCMVATEGHYNRTELQNMMEQRLNNTHPLPRAEPLRLVEVSMLQSTTAHNSTP